MGQGASTPRGNDRAGRGDGRNNASMEQDLDRDTDMNGMENGEEGVGEEGMGEEERLRNMRRMRRFRSHFAQFARLGAGLVPSSRSTNSSESESAAARTYARLQNRLRMMDRGRERSPSGSGPSSRSGSRVPSSLSRFSPFTSSGPRTPGTEPQMPTVEDGSSRTEQALERDTLADAGEGSSSRPDFHSRRASLAGPPTSLNSRSPFSRVRSSLSSSIPSLRSSEYSARPRSYAGTSSARRTSHMDALYDRDDDINMTDADLHAEPNLEGTTPGSNSEGEGGARNQESDQQAVLSRLLSVAAAMTAASLVGSNEQALSEARDVGNDNGEGSFETFLRALRSGHLAAALRNGGSEMGGGVNAVNNGSADGSVVPLNFFRMFRFGPSSNTPPPVDANGQSQRMIPVVIVGIRSVNGQSDGEAGATSPFFDAMPPWNGAREGGARTFPRSRPSSTRTGQSSTEGPRIHRRHSRNAASENQSSMASTLGDLHEDAATPSSARPATSGQAERTDNDLNAAEEQPREANNAEERPQRSSNRQSTNASGGASGSAGTGSGSGSGSGSGRRQPEGTRSWIIYVLGGAYPENHPILTTPSLFTDAPTYEDMVMLSSLIGNVKPPVATREDVDRAGGTFVFGDGSDDRSIQLQGERCLVCLGDYEAGEICRQIAACSHIFHKDCIDEWLTTGRNTCPLCRGEGVERSKQEEAAAAAAGSSESASSTSTEQPAASTSSAAATAGGSSEHDGSL